MKSGDLFEELMHIMVRLRSDCPWDRKQTPESLREYILEEAYEAVDAIDNQDWDELKKELGDLLLQVVFQAVIANEKKRFSIDDVIRSINTKLVERHPHVFGEVQVKDEHDVMDNWEKIKKDKENRTSILEGIPSHMSALLRAQKVQQKVVKVGFDWDKIDDVFRKLDEELAEFKSAVKSASPEEMEEEVGDILFTLVNIARWKGINGEHALRKTTNKFISRFQYIEKKLEEMDRDIHQASLEDMETLWNEAKRVNGNNSN
ncbi:MAG: nucleoside triphosphate pyrophosphohydrolase [Calditrichia bacterium]